MFFQHKSRRHPWLMASFYKLATLFIFSMSLNVVAHADGINMAFNGNIKVASCTVDTGSTNQTVSLGEVGAEQFKTVGDRASATQFGIKLTSCPAGVRGATITFNGTGDSHDSTVLAIDSGGANNVGVELSDITGSKIALGTSSASYGLVTNSDNILSFSARYVATALPVMPGKGDATVQFTVDYQ